MGKRFEFGSSTSFDSSLSSCGVGEICPPKYFVRTVFDMTPGNGAFGEACIKNRVGYFCIALSEAHANALEKCFRAAVLRMMTEEGNPLYNAKAAEVPWPGDLGKLLCRVSPGVPPMTILSSSIPFPKSMGRMSKRLVYALWTFPRTV